MAEKMIPKVINYCWFGNNKKTEKELKCIESWKMFLPDYEVKEWNEQNFNINICEYTKEAYSKKKWAFVSDYARFWILYNYGGIYFDTDVEIIKSIDDILCKGQFLGCELTNPSSSKTKDITASINSAVNPGLGFALFPKSNFAKKILHQYNKDHFIEQDGNINYKNIVVRCTEQLVQDGFRSTGRVEKVDGIYIYPTDFFCPVNYFTGEINITANTRTIHHYTASWLTPLEKRINIINQKYIKEGRPHCFEKKIKVFPFWALNAIEKKLFKEHKS